MRQAAQPILPAFTPQAFISDQTGRTVKTHKGVHVELIVRPGPHRRHRAKRR